MLNNFSIYISAQNKEMTNFVVCLLRCLKVYVRRVHSFALNKNCDIGNMIASLRCHCAYLSITITSSYLRLFIMNYCTTVIAKQQSSEAFTRSLVFSKAVKKDSVTINEIATRDALLQLLCMDACVTTQ